MNWQINRLSNTLVLSLYNLSGFSNIILKFGAHLQKYFILIFLKFHCIHNRNTKITTYFCSHARFLYRVSLTLTLPVRETLPLVHCFLFRVVLSLFYGTHMAIKIDKWLRPAPRKGLKLEPLTRQLKRLTCYILIAHYLSPALRVDRQFRLFVTLNFDCDFDFKLN